jgi:hypothetical protein
MILRNKFIIAALGLVFMSLSAMDTAVIADDTATIEDISFADIAEMEGDNLAELNIDDLRDFDLEEEEMSLKEKIELAMMYFNIKTRGYRSGFLAHISQHGNEYLLGSACIATMLVAALLKSYTNRPSTLIHHANQ